MIEQLEQDQIWYQKISESLLFEHYDLIQETAQLIRQQQDRESVSKMDKKDSFMIFAMNDIRGQTISEYHKFKTEELEKYRLNDSTKIIITIFTNLIKKYINRNNDEQQQQQQQQQYQQQQLLNNNTIIIELENYEIYEIQLIQKKESMFYHYQKRNLKKIQTFGKIKIHLDKFIRKKCLMLFNYCDLMRLSFIQLEKIYQQMKQEPILNKILLYVGMQYMRKNFAQIFLIIQLGILYLE